MISKTHPESEQSKTVTLSTSAVIFFSTLLGATAFFAGYLFFQLKTGQPAVNTAANSNGPVFEVKKSSKPQLKFFVMSFCPYGNQAEDALKPVAELLKDKVDLKPQYIFNKVDNLDTYCKQTSGDPSQCEAYVKNQYFKTVDECKKAIGENLTQCKDEKSYIKASNGTLYSALHGRVEANQNVREICAWNIAPDKQQWWKFVDLVNKNCNQQNADSCWEQQAKDSGYDTGKITDCFNKEGINLIEKEIAETTKFNVSGSPTILINDVVFPPESAYTQDGKGTLKVGNQVLTQDKFRSPEGLKQALCASFNKAPKECKTVLADVNSANTAAAAGGGCGQ